MQKQIFNSYFPLQLNGHLFNDPQLKDLEIRIIALAQLMRLQIASAKSLNEQEEIKKKFTSSYFAAATGKNRDHIRRVINNMQKNEAVKKYVTIFILPKVELNSENVFRFTFHDPLNNIDMKRHAEFDNESDIETKLDYYTETLIQTYIRGIKELSGETARSLIQLARCEPSELVKGLVYLKSKLKFGTVKSPKAYLISSFNDLGKFKYKINAVEYLPSDSDVKVTSDFEFEVAKKEFLDLEKAIKQNTGNNLQFFYRTDGDKLFISKMQKAGVPRNIKNFLKREDIQFKIVAKMDFENV